MTAELEETVAVLREALRQTCRCNDPEVCLPTDWESHVHIPHHCDCPLYPVELPHPVLAQAAYADALKTRARILAGIGACQ